MVATVFLMLSLPAAAGPVAMASDIVTLKEHFEVRILALEKAMDVERAALEKRLAAMNEIREAMRDQAATSISRAEVDMRFRMAEEDLKRLREARAVAEGKASQLSVTIVFTIAIAGLGISTANLVAKKRNGA